MAGLFRNKRVNSTTGPATGIRIQSSIQGQPLPIVCGQTRFAGNMIDYGGFEAIQQQQSGGSKGGIAGGGGKGQTGQYKYYAWGIISFGEQIAAYQALYWGNSIDFLNLPLSAATLAALNEVGILPQDIGGGNDWGATFYLGTTIQNPDPTWNAEFGARALAYRGEAYVMFPAIALGSSPSFPNFTAEITGVRNTDIPTLGPDANPADWISDLLTNATYGLPGFPPSCIGDFNTARNYWRATGLLISDALIGPTALQSYLASLMTALNAEFRWSSGVLDIVPYGDVAVSGNGFTYIPNLAPVYNLGLNDFLPNQGTLGSTMVAGNVPVACERTNVADVDNKVRVEYLDRNTLYNPVTIYATDDASIYRTGRLRLSDLKTNHFFCLASAASVSVQLQLARLTAEMNTYQFTVGRQFVLLDPMDLVTLTEPGLQLSNQLVRITEIQENLDGTLTMTAVEVQGVAAAAVYPRQISQGVARNNNAPAPVVNTPIFFEPPDQLGGGLVIWIGLSGSVPANWGGCEVYVSSDNETYTNVGTFQGSTRMGTLTSSLASITAASTPPTIDTTNTLAVTLVESNGALASGSAADLAAFNTATLVDQEIIAYQTATLTGPNAYNLTTLSRGGYGSAIASHSSGAPFMRLDGNYFVFAFDASRIGAPLYFKFSSFNQFGAGQLSLSEVGPYLYMPTGAALSSPLPNVSNLYSNFEGGFQKIYWDEIKDFRSGILYEIRQGSTWQGALPIRTQAHPPFIAQGNGSFWIAAKCTPIAGLTVYSGTPQEYTISGNQLSLNVVESWDEQATNWPGAFDNGMGTVNAPPNEWASLAGSSNILSSPPPLLESLATNAGSLAGSNVLHFASVPATIVAGMQVNDQSAPTALPTYVTVLSTTLTTVTLSANVQGPGVGSGDTIVFSTYNVLTQGGIPVNTPLHYTAPASHIIDCLYVTQASLNASAVFVGSPVGQNILAIGNILTTADILGAASTALINGWVELAISQDAVTWGPWQKFVPGVQSGRAFKFRMAMESADANTLAICTTFNYKVQIPARIDHYQNQSISSLGTTIIFQPDNAATAGAFNGGPAANNLPYVNVSYPQQTAVSWVITGLSLSELTITFYNASGSPVNATGVNIDVEGY